MQGKQQEETQGQQSQADNIEIRYDLHNAYAYVEGQRSIQSFSAFTAEEAHDRFIERIEGRGTAYRPNVLDRIDRVVHNVQTAVAKVKALPADAFRRADETDVNTKEK